MFIRQLRSARFALLSLGLFLLYLWTLTETAVVTLRVADGRCTATLYGRATTIDCPGLAGGTAAAVAIEAPPAGSAPIRGPLDTLLRPSVWASRGVAGPGSRPLPPDTPLPERFTWRATLRRPSEPAGLVLLPPDGRAGWAFILDVEDRRGTWWTWDGAPAEPLQGIPLDRPLSAQAKSFLRQTLAGWQGALLVVAALWLAGRAVGARTAAPDARRARIAARAARFAPLLACLFAFAVALHVSVDVLGRVPHVQDSVTYLFQAQTLARGRLHAPAPPLAEPGAGPATGPFEQEFLLVQDGRWFGKYPPGYPALLALGVVLNAPWLINPLLAALTIALLHALTRQLYPHPQPRQSANLPISQSQISNLQSPHPPLSPSLLLSLSPFFLIMSGSLMAHPAELFWTTLFMLAWARALGANRPRRWAVVAGLALGALFLTRQFTALSIGLSFGLALGAMHFLKGVAPAPGVEWRSGNDVEDDATSLGRYIARGRWLLRRGGPALLVALPLMLALPLYQAALTGDARTDPRLLYWPYDRVGFGPGVGEPQNAFTMSLTDAGPAVAWYTDPTEPPRGHSPARGLYNLGRNLEALQRDLFGWPPLLTLALVWLLFLWRPPAAVDGVLLLIVLAVAGGYVAYWASGVAYGPRYFYAALPALVILTARGAAALVSGGVPRWAVAGLLVLLMGWNVVRLPARVEGYRGYNFVSAEARRSIEAAVSAPALVFVPAGEADWWEYGAFFSGNTPWLDGPVVYARHRGAAENARLRAHFPERQAYIWRDPRLLPLP